MKRILFLGLCIAFGWCTTFSQNLAEPAEVLRVMSYNIHHGEGTDGQFALPRLAHVIRSVTPDLVALQEVDRLTERSGKVDQIKELARLTGMNYAYGRAMDYDDGQYGVAVLARQAIQQQKNHSLPFTSGHEPRTVLEIQIEFAGQPVWFLATHLDHVRNSPDRPRAIKTIAQWLQDRRTQPMILAGDLNAVPQSQEISLLRQDWLIAGDNQSHLTFPSDAPNRQLDYIAARPYNRWQILDTWVIPESTASDHRPIMAVLRLLSE